MLIWLWLCYYVYMKRMAAAQFKNQCLALMDKVQQTGEPVLITKHGKPVAKLVPVQKMGDDIFDFMAGKIEIVGDMSAVTPLEDWESK